jgi:hypothetical protein
MRCGGIQRTASDVKYSSDLAGIEAMEDALSPPSTQPTALTCKLYMPAVSCFMFFILIVMVSHEIGHGKPRNAYSLDRNFLENYYLKNC